MPDPLKGGRQLHLVLDMKALSIIYRAGLRELHLMLPTDPERGHLATFLTLAEQALQATGYMSEGEIHALRDTAERPFGRN